MPCAQVTPGVTAARAAGSTGLSPSCAQEFPGYSTSRFRFSPRPVESGLPIGLSDCIGSSESPRDIPIRTTDPTTPARPLDPRCRRPLLRSAKASTVPSATSSPPSGAPVSLTEPDAWQLPGGVPEPGSGGDRTPPQDM